MWIIWIGELDKFDDDNVERKTVDFRRLTDKNEQLQMDKDSHIH